MTNIKMQYKWLPTASGCVFTVCVCVCVFTAGCVCTLDGLNAEHNSEYVTSLSVALYTVNKKKIFKRVSFNPYKDMYYCQPLKIK